MLDSPQIQKILELLFQPVADHLSLQTYSILDAAREKVIYQKLLNTDIQKKCLFHGAKAVELATVAPYLVQLKKDDPFTDWLINQGWGKSWGIFFQSSENLDKLQRHFRKFLMVYSEDGKPLYFRFYDPRVLRVYVPTCNESELKIIFGPVNRYCVECEDGNAMIEYSCVGGQLNQRIVQLVITAEP